jgi:hypothetical protein
MKALDEELFDSKRMMLHCHVWASIYASPYSVLHLTGAPPSVSLNNTLSIITIFNLTNMNVPFIAYKAVVVMTMADN